MPSLALASIIAFYSTTFIGNGLDDQTNTAFNLVRYIFTDPSMERYRDYGNSYKVIVNVEKDSDGIISKILCN